MREVGVEDVRVGQRVRVTFTGIATDNAMPSRNRLLLGDAVGSHCITVEQPNGCIRVDLIEVYPPEPALPTTPGSVIAAGVRGALLDVRALFALEGSGRADRWRTLTGPSAGRIVEAEFFELVDVRFDAGVGE
jgi:hypothetical protein